MPDGITWLHSSGFLYRNVVVGILESVLIIEVSLFQSVLIREVPLYTGRLNDANVGMLGIRRYHVTRHNSVCSNIMILQLAKFRGEC